MILFLKKGEKDKFLPASELFLMIIVTQDFLNYKETTTLLI